MIANNFQPIECSAQFFQETSIKADQNLENNFMFYGFSRYFVADAGIASRDRYLRACPEMLHVLPTIHEEYILPTDSR